MPRPDKFSYRPEIDGLRAVAVLAVVLFHAGLACPGGYVGVDVFFVISGFLITALIWKDLESGSFTFANFWERRVRRIIPALVAVTMMTLVVGWFLLLPLDFKKLGQAAAAQAVFAANIYYWRDYSYFAGAGDEKPLLHTWSLAVEEQFYLIIPFLLWGMFRTSKLRSRTAVISVLIVGFVLSFVLSIYGVTHYRDEAFYLLPTRAWEFLLGSLVAFLPVATPFTPLLKQLNYRIVRELFSLASLALILVPVFFYTRDTPFPGLAALPPCLGAALLIWANGPAPTQKPAPTVVGSLLSARPVVFIGLISYSLYLWHWPLLAFGRYFSLMPLSTGQRVALVGVGLLFASFSWKYVETPFRKRKLAASRASIFASAGVGLATVLGCGLLCIVTQGFPQRFSAQARAYAAAALDIPPLNSLATEDIRAGKLTPIGVQNSRLPPTVLVWGDSHAMVALPAIDTLLKEKGLSGRAATHAATAPVLNFLSTSSDVDSVAYNNAVFSYIQSQRIPEVILIARWAGYGSTDTNAPRSPFPSLLVSTVRRPAETGSRPWVILDVPNHSFDIPRALSRPIYSHAYLELLYTRPAARNELDAMDPRATREIEAAGGRILDPKPRFLDPAGQYYIIQHEGIALYFDGNHLTTQGTKLILLPFLRDSLTLTRGAVRAGSPLSWSAPYKSRRMKD